MSNANTKNAVLRSIDLENLVLSFQKNPDAWRSRHGAEGPGSLERCQRLGYLLPNTTSLTPQGTEKARRMLSYVESLKHGVSLDCPRRSRIGDLSEDRWFRCKVTVGKKQVALVASRGLMLCVSAGVTVSEFGNTKVDDEENRAVSEIANRVIDTQATLAELRPAALQISGWPNPVEVACFKGPAGITRIALRYYDLIIEKYKSPTFVQKASNVTAPVIVKVPNGPLKGAAALCMPVGPAGWPDI